MKNSLWTILLTASVLVGCSSFKAQRVDSNTGDEKALEITDKWVNKDTETVVTDVLKQLQAHKGFQKYMRTNGGKAPALFIGEIKNMTSEAYFPINDINDEFLNELSQGGDFTLVDADARDNVLKEITYQHDGMVDAATAKKVGKQTGADLIVFGNVHMKPESRGGKTIKQYAVNIRMTDIEKGIEVLRVRAKLEKFSEQKGAGW
jgi:uncharacterized protein (TIGR02722 family)